MSAVCPDVSEFQVPLNNAFNRDALIFRATFGSGKLDSNFLTNASEASHLYKQGRIAGVILYTVYTDAPVSEQYNFLWRAIGPKPPDWLMGIMIDVESWRGTNYSLSGNHSSQINALYGLHAHKMGSWNSVIAYGNRSDLAELYPGRDRRCRVIVASYGSQLTYSNVPGAIGQQYTDGQLRWGVPRGLPNATSPFGACDHNVFPGFRDGHALRAALRPVVPGVRRPPVVLPTPAGKPVSNPPKPKPPTPKPPAVPAPSTTGVLSILDAPTKDYLDAQFKTVRDAASIIVHGDATHNHGLDELFTYLDSRLSAQDGAIAQLATAIAALKGPAA